MSTLKLKLNTTDKFKLYSNLHYHFLELKLRLSYIIFSLFSTFLTCYYYCFEIIYVFTKPFLYYEKNFIFTDLTEAFYTSIQISFFFSFYLLIPLFLYQFWCFFIPSKFTDERKNINLTFFFVFIFLLASILIVYLCILPKLYRFLLNFQINTNLINIELQPRIKSYVELACKIFIFFTLFSQLPLVFFLLIKYKLLQVNTLAKNRVKIFFFILVVSSFISPPDVLIQITISFFFQFVIEILLLFGFFYKVNQSKSYDKLV